MSSQPLTIWIRSRLASHSSTEPDVFTPPPPRTTRGIRNLVGKRASSLPAAAKSRTDYETRFPECYAASANNDARGGLATVRRLGDDEGPCPTVKGSSVCNKMSSCVLDER